MVEIQPPAEHPLAGDPGRVDVGRAGPVDSQAITRDAISDADLSDVPTGADRHGSVFASDDADAGADDAHAAPLEDPEAAAPQPVGWQSDRTQRARQVGLIAALAVAGIVVAVVTFVFFVRHWQQRQSQRPLAGQQAGQPVGTAQANEVQPTVAASDAAQAPPPAPDAQPQQTTGAAQADAAGDAQRPAASRETDADAVAATDVLTGEVAGDVSGVADEPNDQAAVKTDPGVDESQPSGAGQDADSLLDSVASSILETPAAAPPAAATAPELPAGLRQFTPLIDFGSALPQDAQGGRLQPPPTLDQVRLDTPADDEADAAIEPAEPVDAARWMKMRLALQGQDRPLVHWVRVLTQVTGVPIELDLASVDAAGFDPTQAVDAPQGWVSAEEAVTQIAAGTGLTVKVEPAFVALEVPEAAIVRGLQPALQVDDLMAVGDGQGWLETLRRISGVDTIDSIAEGGGMLHVEGGRPAVWRVALAAEALRAARGLPLRLQRHRTERWLMVGAARDWPLVSGGNPTVAMDQPQSVLQWLGEMARTNDRHLVVAWGDAWQRGLTPQSAAMPWIRPVDAGALIAEVLEPYGLQARDAGGGLWWIGSPASYDRGEVFAVLPVPDREAAEVLERLAQSLPVDAGEGQPKSEALPAVYEASSGQLIVRLPRYVVRQLPKLFAGDAP